VILQRLETRFVIYRVIHRNELWRPCRRDGISPRSIRSIVHCARLPQQIHSSIRASRTIL